MPIADLDTFAAACKAVLDRTGEELPELAWVCVASKGGQEVAAAGDAAAAEHLSVMVGTMLALADTIVMEAALGECQDIILAASRGRVVIMGVQDPRRELVLACTANRQTTLGLLLNWCTAACAEIRALPSLRYQQLSAAA